MADVNIIRPIGAVAAPLSAARLRPSWGAIFAGTAIALAVTILLDLLGLGIGLATIDPASGDTPSGTAFGAWTGVWWLVSMVVALFAGGWVAGRLSGFDRRTNTALHGLVVWGLSSVVMAYFAMSALGSVVGGAFGAVGSALQATTGAVASVAAPVARGAGSSLASAFGTGDTGWQEIKNQVTTALRQTGKQDLDPTELQREAREASAPRGDTQENVGDAEFLMMLQGLVASEDAGSALDRDALANVLAARSDITREEARRQVDTWVAQYQETRQTVSDKLASAKDTAQEVGAEAVETTANTLSVAALWSFFTLMLGAISAGFGGRAAARRDDRADEHDEHRRVTGEPRREGDSLAGRQEEPSRGGPGAPRT